MLWPVVTQIMMVAIVVVPISKVVESAGEVGASVMDLWYLFRNFIFLWFMGKPPTMEL